MGKGYRDHGARRYHGAVQLRLGIDEWCYSQALMKGRMDHYAVIRRAGELGVQGVGLDYFLMPQKCRKDPERFAEALEAHELELVLGFGIPFALPGPVLSFFERDLKRMVQVARRARVNTVRVVGGVVLPIKGRRPIHLSLGKRAEVKEVAANLKKFTRRLAGEGLAVALEYHMDYTANEILEIVERVGEPNFKVNLDTGNALHVGEDPMAVAHLLVPHTAFTHMKDMKDMGSHAECVPLGTGDVPVKAIMELLVDSGYNGLYCLENAMKPDQRELEDDWVVQGVDFLKSVAAALDKKAVKS